MAACQVGTECTAKFILVHVLVYALIVQLDQITVRHADMAPRGAQKLWMPWVMSYRQLVPAWMDIKYQDP